MNAIYKLVKEDPTADIADGAADRLQDEYNGGEDGAPARRTDRGARAVGRGDRTL